MSNRIRPAHVVCLASGAGIGVATGGLIGIEVDMSRMEVRGMLITILGLSCYALMGLYLIRRVAAYSAQIKSTAETIREQGFVEGYAQAVRDAHK